MKKYILVIAPVVLLAACGLPEDKFEENDSPAEATVVRFEDNLEAVVNEGDDDYYYFADWNIDTYARPVVQLRSEGEPNNNVVIKVNEVRDGIDVAEETFDLERACEDEEPMRRDTMKFYCRVDGEAQLAKLANPFTWLGEDTYEVRVEFLSDSDLEEAELFEESDGGVAELSYDGLEATVGVTIPEDDEPIVEAWEYTVRSTTCRCVESAASSTPALFALFLPLFLLFRRRETARIS